MPTDRQLVAHKQNNGSEVRSIASNYKVPLADVKKAAIAVSKTGKPSRSARDIKAYLKDVMGYSMKTRYMLKKEKQA